MSVKGFRLADGSVAKYDYSALENVITDNTLSISGVAADAETVGNEIAQLEAKSFDLDESDRLKISGLSGTTSEVTDRIETLRQYLTAEVSTRSAKDISIESELAESRDRMAEIETGISESIDRLPEIEEDISESKDRLTELETNLSNEIANRIAADNTEKTERREAVTLEKNERVAADNALSTRINIEKSRIDNIEALPDGATTADAELVNIRIGYDNTEYSSAGNAVRAQISDVKADLEELQNEAGVTAELKSALLQLASKVAYIDDDGQSYYDDLYDALYPNAQSITCVYTQTGTVYTATPINSLKDDLVVTAHYSDSTTRVLKPSDYTLSGTLSVGTSTVTVSYGNLTTSFTVTVTSSFSITNTLTNCVNSNSATYSTGGSYTGTISGTTVDYDVFDSDITVTMGGVDVTSTVLNNCVISISDVTGDVVIIAVAHEWKTLINTDASGWAKSKATYSNGVWTITSTALDWNAWLKPAPFLYTYAQRKTNRIRASFDLELSNYTNGDGCQFVPGTYTGNLSGSRVAYPLSQTAYSSGWMTSSGHYSLDTESLTVADIMDEGTPADSNYLGGLIYLNANSGCSAKISNFKYQYLD